MTASKKLFLKMIFNHAMKNSLTLWLQRGILKVSRRDQPKVLLLLQDKKWTWQSSTYCQQMMFTKVYVDWLVKSFNF
jgi:hypothetical protein